MNRIELTKLYLSLLHPVLSVATCSRTSKDAVPYSYCRLDNMNDYYVSIKEWRLNEIEKCVAEHPDSSYTFYKEALTNTAILIKSSKDTNQML